MTLAKLLRDLHGARCLDRLLSRGLAPIVGVVVFPHVNFFRISSATVVEACVQRAGESWAAAAARDLAAVSRTTSCDEGATRSSGSHRSVFQHTPRDSRAQANARRFSREV